MYYILIVFDELVINNIATKEEIKFRCLWAF